MQQQLPRAGFDSTFALLNETYQFISNRCQELDTDVFRTRLLLRPVICMQGAEAAQIFYDGERFTRIGAMPVNTAKLLQDFGSVQQLDGHNHRHRKALFTGILLSDAHLAVITQAFERHWREAETRWREKGRARLLDEMVVVLGRAACAWVGIPCDELGGDGFTRELDRMVENAGRFGPRNWLALYRRSQTEAKIRHLVERQRAGAFAVEENVPLSIIASHRDEDGQLLDSEQVTVELLNLLRPLVAVSRYVVYAAIALEDNPQWQQQFAAGDNSMLKPFVEEVRRTYPFFPFIGGKVRQEFQWRGYTFGKDDWVLLDLYGTNHDPRSFPSPNAFRPERELSWADQGYAFIPHGAGDTHITHRCPGERFTVELMCSAVRHLVELSYEVAPGSTDLPYRQFPPRPQNNFLMTQIGRSPSPA